MMFIFKVIFVLCLNFDASFNMSMGSLWLDFFHQIIIDVITYRSCSHLILSSGSHMLVLCS